MKKILTIIFIFSCFVSFAQPVTNRSNGSVTVADSRLQATLNLFIPRYTDTTAALLGTNEGIDSCGAIIFTYDIMALWFRDCSNGTKRWTQILPSGGGGGGGLSAWLTSLNTNIPTDISLNGYFGTTAANGVGFYTSNTQRLILPASGLTFNQLVTDTTANKVMTFNPVSKEWGYAYWYGGGGSGGSQTWQQTLDVTGGSVLTHSNSITGTEPFTLSVDFNNRSGQLIVDNGVSSFTSSNSTFDTSAIIEVKFDSILIKPPLGNLFIDTLTNVAARYVLHYNPTTGLVSYADTTIVGTNYWTLSGSNLYNNSGTNVGINNTSPSAALDVVGNFLQTGDDFSANVGGFTISATGSGSINSPAVTQFGDVSNGIYYEVSGSNNDSKLLMHGLASQNNADDSMLVIKASDGTVGYRTIPTGGSSSLTVGTTAISGGTNTKVLYNNSGILGEYTVSGSGNVAMTTSAALTTPTIATSITPASNDGATLGTTALQFSDLFLAEGGVINWDNGDVTLTQSGNNLTIAGADLFTMTGASIGSNPLMQMRTSGLYAASLESSGSDTYVAIGQGIALNNTGILHFNQVSSGSTSNSFRFGLGANFDLMTLEATGNFGIGTTSPKSLLTVNGSFATAIVGKTANYTATILDNTIVFTSGTDTLTLPTAVGIEGREYIYKNLTGNNGVVATTSSQTIDGVAAPLTGIADKKWYHFKAFSGNWIITANN